MTAIHIHPNGYLATDKVVEQIGEKLLPAADRKALAEAAPKLDELWQKVATTCPRYVKERLTKAREMCDANPACDKSFEEYEKLLAEPEDYVRVRHERALAKWNSEAYKLAPYAIRGLKALRDELVRRKEKLLEHWQHIIGLFPESLNDVKLDSIIENRIENTVRSIGETIAQLRRPGNNYAVWQLANLGLLPVKSETRQAGGSEHHDPADVAAAEAA